MVKVILNLLLLTGCASAYKANTKIPADQLKPYITSFELLYGIEVKTPIYFADIANPAVGLCSIWSNGDTEIVIDNSYYNEYKNNHNAIEQLVFHELGHCVFKRNHRTDVNSNNIPESIMYPYVFGDQWYYQSNHYYYLNELSTGRGEVQMVVPYLEFVD